MEPEDKIRNSRKRFATETNDSKNNTMSNLFNPDVAGSSSSQNAAAKRPSRDVKLSLLFTGLAVDKELEVRDARQHNSNQQ